MLNKIIAIYAITDDLLKAIKHNEDYRRAMNDTENYYNGYLCSDVLSI